MDDRLPEWRPSPEEVEKILVEMRPIIQAFATKARRISVGPRAA